MNVQNCEICRQYKKWCIEIARSKWQPEFKSFPFVIAQTQIQNKKFFNFGKVSSADRDLSSDTETNKYVRITMYKNYM